MTGTTRDVQLSARAYDILREQLALLRQHEAGTRAGQDPEELHDMRVATRRLREALRSFELVLPAHQSDELRRELAWLGSGLSAVRDLDVQLERVADVTTLAAAADREAVDSIRAALSADREVARAELTKVLDSARYRSMLASGADLLTRPSDRRTSLSVGGGACALVEQPFRKFRKLGDRIQADSSPEDFHAVRKRAKRLRYTVEFLADVDQASARRFVRRLVALQDILGKHQDAEVAIAQLRTLTGNRRADRPELLFALGQLAQRSADEAESLRSSFARAYRRVTGKRWRRLHQQLRRAAAQAGPNERLADEGEPVRAMRPHLQTERSQPRRRSRREAQVGANCAARTGSLSDGPRRRNATSGTWC